MSKANKTRKIENSYGVRINFGFLPTHLGFCTRKWCIEPLSDYAGRVQQLKSQVAHDGYLYPSRYGRLNPEGELREEPTVPGNLFRVPASHQIIRVDGLSFDYDLNSEAFFLTQCLGLLYDQRVTFEHWWLDGRVRYQKGVWGDAYTHVASHYLEVALRYWCSLQANERSMLNRALMMHLRVDRYQWDFERFTFSYSVIDTLFRIARTQGQISDEGSHGGRLEKLLALVGAAYDQSRVKMIVKIRNNLIHEVKWDQGFPLTATGHDGLQCSLWLPHLNRRLIVGLVGYCNEWVKSPWWSGGTFLFDRIPENSK